MNARNLFIACGIHADSITEQAATELLAYNRGQNAGMWEHGMKRGEHVPVWTGALRTDSDNVRLQAWLEGHKAHGAKRMVVQPVNGFGFTAPLLSGFVLAFVGYTRNKGYTFAYTRN